MKKLTTLALAVTCLFQLAASAAEWTVLFDGKPTDKLRAYRGTGFPSTNWIIDNDALKTVPGKAIDLVTIESYKDFELEAEWKVQPGGNSGII